MRMETISQNVVLAKPISTRDLPSSALELMKAPLGLPIAVRWREVAFVPQRRPSAAGWAGLVDVTRLPARARLGGAEVTIGAVSAGV
jgi:hypothetical protein